MHHDTKKKITAAIDALANDGKRADGLTLHPATAQKHAIHGTHLDWGSEDFHHDEDRIVGELTHPEYDERPEGDPHQLQNKTTARYRPKTAAEAGELAKGRSHEDLRRPGVVLVVTLDSRIEGDKFRVTASVTTEHAEEV